MCNRKIYEASLKKAFPGAKIIHKVALPGTVTVEADGKQGKRWCAVAGWAGGGGCLPRCMNRSAIYSETFP